MKVKSRLLLGVLSLVFLVGVVNVASAYTLNYSVSDPNNSRIAGETPQTVAPGGDGTEVYAYPYFGYRFVDWSDSRTDNPRTDLNVTGDIDVVANFVVYNPWTEDLELDLVVFSESFDTGTLWGSNYTVQMVESPPGSDNWVLEVTWDATGNGGLWFDYPEDNMDLSAYRGIAYEITNTGDTYLRLYSQVNCSDGWADFQSFVGLQPGETDILYTNFGRGTGAVPQYLLDFFDQSSMRGAPGGHVFRYGYGTFTSMSGDFKLGRFNLDDDVGVCTVNRIWAAGRYQFPTEQELLDNYQPCIDKYGQYKDWDWKGKAHSDEELQVFFAEDDADMLAHPKPLGWNQYGGWASAPSSLTSQLTATGRFHVEKDSNDVWWIVDPEGKPFLSQGEIGMGSVSGEGSASDFTGKTHLFEELPACYSFRRNNMLLRLGDTPDFEDRANDLQVAQFWSYGLNTVGGFSGNGSVARGRNFPYCLHMSSHGGFYYTVPSDLNEVDFRAGIRSKIETSTSFQQAIGDPWCVGCFWHNEIDWASPDDVSSEIYYRVINEEIKLADPNLMYLGSKSKKGSSTAWYHAGLYCDVMSVDKFGDLTPSTSHSAWKQNRPVMMGAFTMAALDGGIMDNSTVGTLTSKQRGLMWENYVRKLYEHPCSVGAHGFAMKGGWFWQGGQQIGWIDGLGLPYKDLIESTRAMASDMYTIHSGMQAILYQGDLNLDGKVDFKDVAELGTQWQSGYDMNTLRDIADNWLIASSIPPLPASASNPYPGFGAMNIDKNTDLSWTAGEDATSYDVYFGTSSPPPFIGNQTGTTFDPGTMAYSTMYYWQIDSVNGWGKTVGEEWMFSTGMPPPP